MSYYGKLLQLNFNLRSDIESEAQNIIASFSLNRNTVDISFSIDKTMDQKENNKATVTIYNMDTQKFNLLSSATSADCTIMAGYSQNTGMCVLFAGDIVGIKEEDGKEGGHATIIELSTGAVERKKGIHSVSIRGEVTLKDAITEILRGSSLYVTDYKIIEDLPPFRNRGLTMYGNRLEMLQDVFSLSDFYYSIDDNLLSIYPRKVNTMVHDAIMKVSSSNGMGTPRALYQTGDQDSDSSQVSTLQTTIVGWEVEMFLTPSLSAGSGIVFNSKKINGLYTVDSLTHAGDTYQSCFTTTVRVKS